MADQVTCRASAAAVVDVRCDYDSFHRLLCQVTEAGLLLLCKSCRRVHLVSWEQMEHVRAEVAFRARTR